MSLSRCLSGFRHQATVLLWLLALCGYGLAAEAPPVISAGEAAPPSTEETFAIRHFRWSGATLLSDEVIESVLQPYTGEHKTLADLFAAADALKKYYQEAGYPVVRVFAPDQISHSGEFELRVIEGKVVRVLIQGARFRDKDNIRQSLPKLIEGEALRIDQLSAGLALVNENSSKQMAVNLEPADAPGALTARIKVSDDEAERVTLTASNSGSATTGRAQLSVGYQNDNLFNLDHVLTAQLGLAPSHLDRSQNISLGYRAPLYRLGVSVEGVAAYSNSDSGVTTTPNGEMTFLARGLILGLKVNQPLAKIGAYRHKWIYGADFKDNRNACSANGFDQSPVFCGSVGAQPVSVSYSGQWQGEGLRWSGQLGYYRNLAGGPRGGPGDYDPGGSQTTYRSAHWQAWRWQTAMLWQVEQWLLSATISGQFSPNVMIGSEQFGIGGANSVRGYNERTYSGELGHSASLSLQTPDFAKSLLQDRELPWPLAVSGLAFVDWGKVSARSGAGANLTSHHELASVGFGLRAGLGRDWSLRLDFGMPLIGVSTSSAQISRDRGSLFAHLLLSYTF